jgi:NurA-like 5'-3' nuclease
MPRKPNMHEKNIEEKFLSDAILDLKQGLTTYIYKEHILDKLKEKFNDLDIRRNDFYWTVKNNEVNK